MSQYKVYFYNKPDGTEPVKDFLLGLDKKMRAKCIMELALLADNGPSLREPQSKPLSDGIFELRISLGTDAARILYFFCVGREIILTNGFVKKTSKTPTSEIKRAKEFREEFLSRKERQK